MPLKEIDYKHVGSSNFPPLIDNKSVVDWSDLIKEFHTLENIIHPKKKDNQLFLESIDEEYELAA